MTMPISHRASKVSFSLPAFILMVWCFSGVAQSTNEVRPAPPARNQIGAAGMVSRSLSLTDTQAKKLEPVFKEQQARMSSLRTNRTLSRQERMAGIQAMRKDSAEKMKPHLTSEQLEKWQQMRSGPAAISQGKATNRFNFSSERKPEAQKVAEPLEGAVPGTNVLAAPASQAGLKRK